MDRCVIGRSLPPSLGRRAEITGGGELLWPADVVLEAIRWADDEGLAVLGVEVYVGMKLARGHFERDSMTRVRWEPRDQWAEFARASAADARAAVREDLERRARRPADDGADPMYFIAVVSEAEYGSVGRHR